MNESRMSRNIKYVYDNLLIEEANKNPAVKGRASLTHNLIQSYGLLKYMTQLKPKKCNNADLKAFHHLDYIQSLHHIECTNTVIDSDCENENKYLLNESRGLAYDCPAWIGIKQYVYCIAGSTMTACEYFCKTAPHSTQQQIVINWCGGWHHAQKHKAAGFCYVNDVVLGILVLTKTFQRIFYVDLDVHHGDGVEEAFAGSRRVFTLSLHQFECGFYPGSGSAYEIGRNRGLGYTINFPYKAGITGDQFIKYFKNLFTLGFDLYEPDVLVVQCGADVIVDDPLGGTNLTPKDISVCIEHILSYGKPTLFLGGGGYNFINSARYWCLLTATICETELPDDIPEDNEDFLRYGPDYCLAIESKLYMQNHNTNDELNQQFQMIKDNLKFYHSS